MNNSNLSVPWTTDCLNCESCSIDKEVNKNNYICVLFGTPVKIIDVDKPKKCSLIYESIIRGLTEAIEYEKEVFKWKLETFIK